MQIVARIVLRVASEAKKKHSNHVLSRPFLEEANRYRTRGAHPAEQTSIIVEYVTNQSGYVTNLLEHLPNLNETGISPDENATSLVSP